MGNNEKSSGASASFSSKALELVQGKIKSTTKKSDVFALGKIDEVQKNDQKDWVTVTDARRSFNMGESLEISDQAKKLGQQVVAIATTVDTGAPNGSSKRLKSYGDAQMSTPKKGSGFDSTV